MDRLPDAKGACQICARRGIISEAQRANTPLVKHPRFCLPVAQLACRHEQPAKHMLPYMPMTFYDQTRLNIAPLRQHFGPLSSRKAGLDRGNLAID
jgi:hypothetical protein